MPIEGGARRATAEACANIAFVKYWGDADPALHLPANPSISMNLDGLTVTTTVAFEEGLAADHLLIGGRPAANAALQRVSALLDQVRAQAEVALFARVISSSHIPMGAGLASSAAAFAALALAASEAAGLHLDEAALSALARRGSGSACRSVPAGFVVWEVGTNDTDSVARSIAAPTHWALRDCVALVSRQHKRVGSAEGHLLAASSPLHALRVRAAAENVALCRRAILARDLHALGRVMEADAILLHGVAMTSQPPIYYLSGATLEVMRAVAGWRAEGLPVYYTIDAGPNVHCLCEEPHAAEVAERLVALPGVQEVLVAGPGGRAHLLAEHPA
ncbi:MAG: diphosphomevalonate decarboxylase [Anaerolineae bacterium]